MVIVQSRPSDARKTYIGEGQIEHDRVVRLGWEYKYGRILDQSTEKIGRVNIVKPGWWKQADVHISEEDKKPRDLDQLVTIMAFAPKNRRFLPHTEPDQEITDHLPSLSMQFSVPEEERKVLSEYEGRLVYLKRRCGIPLNQRFAQPPNINATYGWEVLQRENVMKSSPRQNVARGEKDKQFGHNPVIADEFFRSAGVINARKNSTFLDVTTK